jgi:hypothetical protein
MLQAPLYFPDSVFSRIHAGRADSLSPVKDTAVRSRLNHNPIGGDLAIFSLGSGYVTLVQRQQYALVRVFDARYREIAAAEQVVEK